MRISSCALSTATFLDTVKDGLNSPSSFAGSCPFFGLLGALDGTGSFSAGFSAGFCAGFSLATLSGAADGAASFPFLLFFLPFFEGFPSSPLSPPLSNSAFPLAAFSDASSVSLAFLLFFLERFEGVASTLSPSFHHVTAKLSFALSLFSTSGGCCSLAAAVLASFSPFLLFLFAAFFGDFGSFTSSPPSTIACCPFSTSAAFPVITTTSLDASSPSLLF
mmetsp:Transcript_5369/g.9663  ORF Transcript_5369/g.9663 Transcript_5369/m.9663 type:complete len:220 (+) Transcript_5369:1569-2228(+)